MGKSLVDSIAKHSGVSRRDRVTDDAPVDALAGPPYVAPHETFAEWVYRKGKETYEYLTGAINSLIGAPSTVEDAPLRDAPSPTPSSKTTTPMELARRLAALEKEREAAAALSVPAAYGYNYRPETFLRTPVDNAVFNVGWAVKAQARLEDHQAPLRSYIDFVEPTTGQRGAHPVNLAMSNMYPAIKTSLTGLLPNLVAAREYAQELLTAKRKSVSPKRLYEILNFVPTLWHLLTEGYDAYRSVLTDDVAAAEKYAAELRGLKDEFENRHKKREAKERGRLQKRIDDAKSAAVKARNERKLRDYKYDRAFNTGSAELKTLLEIDKAEGLLKAAKLIVELYDRYQATGRGIVLTGAQASILNLVRGKDRFKEGSLYHAAVPGGINAVKAAEMWAEAGQYLTEAEMRKITGLTVEAFEKIYQARLKGGVASPEARTKWHPFVSYVPLALNDSPGKAVGNHEDGYVVNPTKTDYVRFGYQEGLVCAGALDLLDKYTNNAAIEIGSRDFVHLLNDMARRLWKKNMRNGLVRILMNERGTGPRNRNSRRQREAAAAPGYIHREYVPLKEGGYKELVWKITFQDFRDMALTGEMRKALSTIQDNVWILNKAAGVNRWIGSLYTRWRAVFPVISAVKDFGERFLNVFAHGDYRLAKGGVVDGMSVAKRMGALSLDWSFVTTYAKASLTGSAPDTLYGGYYKEFVAQGTNYSFLSLLKELNERAKLTAGPKAMGAFRRALAATGFSKVFQTVERVVDKWNDFFNCYPIFSQYVALREAGVAVKDAASYTLDTMNYFKRGSWEPVGSAMFAFFRPTIQGGANLLKTLNPFSKTGNAQQLRGIATFAALLGVSMLLVAFLRAAAEDEDEGNGYDALDTGTVNRFANFFLEDGKIARVPVPFGAAHLAWSMANIQDRYSRGQMDAGEAAVQLMLALNRQFFPDNYPAYEFGQDPIAWTFQTLSPQPLRPWIDLMANKNHWGSEINYGNQTVGLRDFEKGRITTPTVWHSLAKTAAESPLKADFTPESWQYILSYHAFGPLQGIIAFVEQSRLYDKPYESTRSMLGPMLTALGAASVAGAPPNITQTLYYREKDRIEDKLVLRGVRVTDEENDTPAEKAAFVTAKMREGGFSELEIKKYLSVIDIERQVRKLNEARLKQYRDAKFDYGLFGAVKKEIGQTDLQKQDLYRGFVRDFGIKY